MIAKRLVNGLGVRSGAGRLLDPCVGPGTFLKALVREGITGVQIDCFDVDPDMVEQTRAWAAANRHDVSTYCGDYLELWLPNTYDFAILNPPYVRQEWIGNKAHYKQLFSERYGLDVPGTANLYTYFVAKTVSELKVGGRIACVLYDSWQSTKYGRWLESFLHRQCADVCVEPVGGMPFDGHLIDATLIFATRCQTKIDAHKVASTLPIANGSYSNGAPGLAPICDNFSTKRGLRLKQSDFFLSSITSAHIDGATPFVKKVTRIEGFGVREEHDEAALLVQPRENNKKALAELNRRLAEAKKTPDENVSILTWHRERPDSWNRHGAAPTAPIIFNYYLRHRPKHIYNPVRAYSDNFYGLTPTGSISPLAWLAALNSTASVIGILERARNQGAGLAKVQLFEYRSARVIDLSVWSTKNLQRMEKLGAELVSGRPAAPLLRRIDALVASVLGESFYAPAHLSSVLNEVERRARRPKE